MVNAEIISADNISVVIPFYEAYDFFEEALDSVKNQTVKVSEIIVINDGCGEKAKEYLNQFEGITVINFEQNSGPSIARNTGAQKAKSDWVAFLDADDIWYDNKIEQQIAFLTKHPEFSCCHTGVETFNSKGIVSVFNDKPFDLKISDLLISSHVTPPSMLIKKSALESANYFDVKMRCSEDHDLSIRLLEQGFKIGFVSQTLTKVRRMDHGNISSNGRSLIIGHWQLLKKNYHLFKKLKGSTSYFIYKTFMTAGSKSKGIEKKSYYLLGKVFSLFAPKNWE
jgi:glycosyltransferase involved in cell wall biosynthesis